eukprot:evm.model.scf_2946.1 EVM.evm.TU.scf_2946.1   scf_2946:711-5771(-)
MFSRLFEVAEEDSFLLVIRHISELLDHGETHSELLDTPGSNFIGTCKKLLAEEDHVGLLEKLTAHIGLLFEQSAEKDAESCIQIICHLMPRLPPGDSQEAASDLAAALSSEVQSHTVARLRSLLNLYNVLLYPEERYATVVQIAKYATDAGLAGMLVPVVKGKAEEYARGWGLSVNQKKHLFCAFAALFRACESDKSAASEALALTTKALALVEVSDSAGLKSIAGEAANALRSYIVEPGLFASDLPGLPAVQQLEKDPKHGPLYKLFAAMLEGNLGFLDQCTGVIKELGVTKEHCVEKMRMMALLSLAKKSIGKTVPFSDIQNALGITTDEVELWIVKGIGSKLLEAKIDQKKSTALITRCTQKFFGKGDWHDLHAELGRWKEMLAGVEGMLAEAHPQMGPKRPLRA